VAKTASHFEEQVNLNQKDTLWKIAECEELLKTRITVQKTEQLLQSLEKKVSINLRKSEDQTMQRNNKEHKEVQEKIDELSLFCNERFTDINMT
jgi:hypothetical protein